jgi:hypothetical protein
MQNILLTDLRTDFTAAISSLRSEATLDPSIGELRERISGASFLEPFSIYSRGHLRKIDGCLCHISNAGLKDNPARVAAAVGSILELFDKLEITIKQISSKR